MVLFNVINLLSQQEFAQRFHKSRYSGYTNSFLTCYLPHNHFYYEVLAFAMMYCIKKELSAPFIAPESFLSFYFRTLNSLFAIKFIRLLCFLNNDFSVLDCYK